MKHTFTATTFLVLIFILAQLVGLVVINEYVDIGQSSRTGEAVINQYVYNNSIGGAPPPVENKLYSALLIFFAILAGTLILLFLIKHRLGRFMKLWFFLAIVFCLGKAFSPFILKAVLSLDPKIVSYSKYIAVFLAVTFALLKLYRNNVFVHNFTEIFIYGGLCAFVVPILNIAYASLLLIAISLYDMYAVWQSKHMVKMAKFQSSQQMFAGLMIPYSRVKGKKVPMSIGKDTDIGPPKKDSGIRTAILGGGDIAFPLIFSGVLLWETGHFLDSLIITLTSAIALSLLFYFSKKDKFYPAMPFISAGCFIGFGIVKLLAFI